MKHCVLLFLMLSFSPFYLYGQIGINTDGSSPDPSSILDVASTDKGMLVPRLTSTQRALISNPATGLLVFDLTTGSFWFYGGTEWQDLSNTGPIVANHTSETVKLADNVSSYKTEFGQYPLLESNSQATLPRIFTIGSGSDADNRKSAITVLNNGKVGINTDDPDADLEVQNDAPEIRLTDGAVDAQASWNTIGAITFNTRDATNNGGNTDPSWTVGKIEVVAEPGGVAPDGQLEFSTGKNAEGVTYRMVIDNDGDVGIGTREPEQLLHLSGIAGIDGIRFPDNTVQTTAYPAIDNSLDVVRADSKLIIMAGSIFHDGTQIPGVVSSGIASTSKLGTGHYRVNLTNTLPSGQYPVVTATPVVTNLFRLIRVQQIGQNYIEFKIADLDGNYVNSNFLFTVISLDN